MLRGLLPIGESLVGVEFPCDGAGELGVIQNFPVSVSGEDEGFRSGMGVGLGDNDVISAGEIVGESIVEIDGVVEFK